MSELNKWKRKDLLALPQRPWNMFSTYDSLLLVPSGKKHDSGYALIVIVGCREMIPLEQAACCDDICWKLPTAIMFGSRQEHSIAQLRMDCLYPAGLMHAWGDVTFTVAMSLSSTDVVVAHRPRSNSQGTNLLPKTGYRIKTEQPA